jgi:hypothetical protein
VSDAQWGSKGRLAHCSLASHGCPEIDVTNTATMVVPFESKQHYRMSHAPLVTSFVRRAGVSRARSRVTYAITRSSRVTLVRLRHTRIRIALRVACVGFVLLQLAENAGL